MVSAMPRLLYPRERNPAPIIQEPAWTPEPVRTVAENLAPTGIRPADHTDRSESLYLPAIGAHEIVTEGLNQNLEAV